MATRCHGSILEGYQLLRILTGRCKVTNTNPPLMSDISVVYPYRESGSATASGGAMCLSLHPLKEKVD